MNVSMSEVPAGSAFRGSQEAVRSDSPASRKNSPDQSEGPSLRIGALRVSPPFILAPMAGLTHVAFRELVAEFGGCGLYYTEMLNSRVIRAGNPATDPYCFLGKGDRPLVAQVAGNEEETVAEAFLRLQTCGSYDAYDFNLGCPRGAIQRYGWGACLLADPERVKRILRKCRAVVRKPFVVKMRSPGEAHDPLWHRWAELLEECGVDAVVLHPRRADDLFKRPARWKEIAAFRSMVRIPVIGNGDVFSPQDAVRMMEETGCRGVMIGRVALMRPWIFRDLEEYVRQGTIPPPPDAVQVLDRFWEKVQEWLPERLHEHRVLLFCNWFCQNFPYGMYYFGRMRREKTPSRMINRLRDFLARERFSGYPIRPRWMS